MQWLRRDGLEKHRGVLEIVGRPGSGKSTLMRCLLENARASSSTPDEGCVLGFFFDGKGNRLTRSATGLFRTLLHQLAISHPSCFLDSDLDLESDGFSETKWLQFFISLFSSHSRAPRKTTVFIDELDECQPGDIPVVERFLRGISTTAFDHGVNLSILLSRREYPELIIHRETLVIRMAQSNIQDIRQCIQQQLGLVSTITSLDATHLEECIAERSSGIFLWVVLTVDGILRDTAKGMNTKRILTRTGTLPKPLEGLFGALLGDIDAEDRATALKLFQWSTLATGKLRVREWHHILAFIRDRDFPSLGAWRDSDFSTENDEQLERQIKHLSQGLLGIRNSAPSLQDTRGDFESIMAGAGSMDSTTGDSRIVVPIHETVREFFLNGCANKALGLAGAYDFMGMGHLVIANTCFVYLMISELDGLAAARILARKNSTSRSKQTRHLNLSNSSSSSSSSRAASFMSSASTHSFSSLQIEHWEPDKPKDHKSPDPNEESNLPQPGSKEAEPLITGLTWDDITKLVDSQLLEEDPSLVSYAINKSFLHAKSAHDARIIDNDFIRDLRYHGRWDRWYALQENITKQDDLYEFLFDPAL